MRFTIAPDRSQVWVSGSSSIHPIHATAKGLEGWFEAEIAGDGSVGSQAAGRVEIAVERLRSGNPLIDRETRRRMDARHHRSISGELTAVDGVVGSRMSVRGVIALRGQEHEVVGELDITATNDGVRIEGEQTFDVRDWGLEPPALLAIRVHPEITVRIVVEAVRD